MATAALKPCPLCRKPSVEAWHPFCSKRCADVDLGRWLGETYRVPTDESLDKSDDNSDDGDGT